MNSGLVEGREWQRAYRGSCARPEAKSLSGFATETHDA